MPTFNGARSLVKSRPIKRTFMAAMVVVVAVAAVGSVVGVAARDARGAVQAGCGPTLVFLVWPHGHPAIPRYSEFPRIPNPHIELYVGLKGYDAANAGAWIIGGKPPKGITRGGFFTNCANYGDPLTAGTDGSITVCADEGVVDLFALLGSGPDAGGTWTAPGGGAATSSYTPGTSAPGAYVYTVTPLAPCAIDQATVTVTQNDALGANSTQGLVALPIVFGAGLVIYAVSSVANRRRGIDVAAAQQELPPE